jgi:hypothetical protein
VKIRSAHRLDDEIVQTMNIFILMRSFTYKTNVYFIPEKSDKTFIMKRKLRNNDGQQFRQYQKKQTITSDPISCNV